MHLVHCQQTMMYHLMTVGVTNQCKTMIDYLYYRLPGYRICYRLVPMGLDLSPLSLGFRRYLLRTPFTAVPSVSWPPLCMGGQAWG